MLKLIKESYYGEDFEKQVLILCPHGSSGEAFFEMFPMIKEHPEVKKNIDLFNEFIEVEKDTATHELCHEIAKKLLEKNIGSIVFELDYPRAIVDGGRVLMFFLIRAKKMY